MATDKDFPPADWQAIEAAPFMAGLAITYGDLSNKVAIADEAGATGDAIKAGATSSSEIVRSIAARFAAGQRPALPVEANAYARFLLDCANAAAGAAREGGLIGVGIRKVSEGEQLALANLALALGLPE
jgi:hypothetical protein